jgi:hypothetical protein
MHPTPRVFPGRSKHAPWQKATPPARPNNVTDLRARGTTRRRQRTHRHVVMITLISLSRCRCRRRASHLGSFLHLVEAPHDHLALGGLANVFRGVLEGVGEEGESCGTFDGVDCARVQWRQSCVSKKEASRTKRERTRHDKTLERDLVGNGRVWEDERAGGDVVNVGRRG